MIPHVVLSAGLVASIAWVVFGSVGCGSEPVDPEDFVARTIPMYEGAGAVKAESEGCLNRAPLRQAFFGDLHVHTALSSDAWNYDVEVRPRDAYAYAFGESIWLPPKDAQGNPTREVRIDRPLDFMAVTDHAEFLGETSMCSNPDSPGYESETSVEMRASTTPLDSPFMFAAMSPWPYRQSDLCGDDSRKCLEAARSAWDEVIEAAEEWNDRSGACNRTTFIAYEYSSIRLASNLHRNVVFRNHIVPRRPMSFMDLPREWDLWEVLRSGCADSKSGCDVIAIPHNSNISNGRMFNIDYPETSTLAEQVDRATLRARIEPLVEVMQHKGDSECRVEMSGILGEPDEYCNFEKMEAVRFKDDEGNAGSAGECWDFMADSLPHMGPGGCMNHRSYVRYVLTEGLAEEERLGVNPFKLGLMGSTDTHNGLGGGVVERSWPGHVGIVDADETWRLSEESGMGNVSNNPGGLIGVWAEENSRDSIFDAMQRREVFGTSGPRIQPRFFGGWNYPEDLCEQPDFLARADREGTPMGQDLPGNAGGSPTFVAYALADPGSARSPGTDLQRIQVIKGWVDEDGGLHEKVFEVAGGDNGATVDPDTCQTVGRGARRLCAVWRDPEFDAGVPAVYYARVLENPTCRYSAWQCLGRTSDEGIPSGCGHGIMDRFIQERAWTSPIWYTPAQASAHH